MSLRSRLWFGLVGMMFLLGCQEVKTIVRPGGEIHSHQKILSIHDRDPASSRAVDPFLDDLKRGYIKLSEDHWQSGDHEGAKIYADKALEISRNRPPRPSELKNLKLPETTMAQLAQAREFVIDQFSKHIMKDFPEGAAKAQLMFDCWLEEEKTDKIPVSSKHCKQDFIQAKKDIEVFVANPSAFPRQARKEPIRHPIVPLAGVSSGMKSASAAVPAPLWPFASPAIPATGTASRVVGQAVLPARPPAQQMQLKQVYNRPAMPAPYVVMVNPREGSLAPEAKNSLDKIITDAAAYKPDRIMVTGHADRIEDSEKQVQAVITHLLDNGLDRRLFDDLRAYDDMPNSKACRIDIRFVRFE